MGKSKTPTGLKITRDGNKFKASWTKGETYKSQDLEYKINSGSWHNLSVSHSVRSGTLTIDLSDYYPRKSNGSKLTSVSFRVRGKANNKDWSGWENETYKIKKPDKPSKLKATLDSELANKCKFSWEHNVSGTESLYRFEYKTVLKKDCDTVPGKKVKGWSSISHTTAKSWTKTEDSSALVVIVDGKIKTHARRYFAVRAVGEAGASEWAYTSHAYGPANAATITNAKSENRIKENSSGGYDLYVEWSTPQSGKAPVDSTEVQWAIAQPNSDLTPYNPSWETARTQKDVKTKKEKKKSTNAAYVSTDDRDDLDECLYVRINTTHDRATTNGVAVLWHENNLKKPKNLSIQDVQGTPYAKKISAENDSSVEDVVIAVIFRNHTQNEEMIIGILTDEDPEQDIQCPEWADDDVISIAVKAMLPSSEDELTPEETEAGVDIFSIDPLLVSQEVRQSDVVISEPVISSAERTDVTGSVRVKWKGAWSAANRTELSWADHRDAWESTEEPETYRIGNSFTEAWTIAGLEVGKTWYIRVRQIKESGETEIYGPYSGIKEVNLTDAPNVPELYLSADAIPIGGQFTASWDYESNDGSPQRYAEICTALIGTDNQVTYGAVIASVTEEEFIELDSSSEGIAWNTAGTRSLCVRVASESTTEPTAWSDPKSIEVLSPLTCSITATNLSTDQETGGNILEEFSESTPLTVTITGAGADGTNNVTIERVGNNRKERPDGYANDGYDGETIASITSNETTFIFAPEDLIGHLDDEADYRIIASAQDEYGQSAESEPIGFIVAWTHQALMPDAEVYVDPHDMTATIRPVAPVGALETDTCDIYRLSVDKPMLIVKGAAFGTAYVDPFPAFGPHGGHRMVFMTENGDYITADGILAWRDTKEPEGDILRSQCAVIDFDGERIELAYDLKISRAWDKGFEVTRYAGGAVNGDWVPGVILTEDLKGAVVTTNNPETIEAMHRLAEHTGYCHVRTPDGSSITADVQVKEDIGCDTSGKVASFSMSITRIDPSEPDGMTLAKWREMHELG